MRELESISKANKLDNRCTFRYTAWDRAYDLTGNIDFASDFLGHQYIRTTQGYIYYLNQNVNKLFLMDLLRYDLNSIEKIIIK